MRQSNGYIIGFSAALTIVLGGLLALAATLLREPQRIQKELDKKKQILGAVMNIPEGVDVLKLYDDKIEGVVTNYKGDIIDSVSAEDINIRKEYKKTDYKEKLFPVFKFKSPVHEGVIDAYILPVYGNGLWDEIWGFVAIESDFNTIKGVVFDHKAETPGLGARITETDIQKRFKGRKIFDKSWDVESVYMIKGENNEISKTDYHSVDGLSGATMTTLGLNKMLKGYFNFYDSFFATEYMRLAQVESKENDDILNMKPSDRFVQ